MAAVSGVSTGTLASTGLNFTGLATGIDTSKLIDGLLAPDKARIQELQSRQTDYGTQQDTFKTIEAKLLDLQSQAGRLTRSFGSVFDARQVSSSDDTALKAAASSSAVAGSYSLKIKTLAQNQQIASSGFTDPSAALKTGSIQIKVGNGATTSITVDATNNTLQGLARAINDSGADVTASVINDGSGTPYRLLLSATNTGAANTIQITNQLTNGDGSSINLDPTTQTIQDAGDAEVVLGSGNGALTVHSATNQVEGLIDGVTINLLQADPTKTVTLNVSNDTTTAHSAISDFVNSYNAVVDFISTRSTFDAQKQQGGILLGNLDAGTLLNDLNQTLNVAISGLKTQGNRLSAIGITFDSQGKLVLDDGKLDQALSGQVSGVSFADVQKLFGFSGASTNPGISFLLGSDKTKTPSSPVQVDITQVARQASLQGTAGLAASTDIGSDTRDVNLTINGKTATIQLTEGTYTPAELAQELQTRINSSDDLGNPNVSVSLGDGNTLKITTAGYGSSARVTINSGSALDKLKLTAGQTAMGADVAGRFLVNGVEETATGTGQILTGNGGNANTDGLQVRVSLTAPADGVDGSLTLTRGIASQLSQKLNGYLDPISGRMKTIDDSYQNRIDDLQKTIDRENSLMSDKNDALVQRFAAMEAAVSQLKSTGDQLSAQLASLTSTKQ